MSISPMALRCSSIVLVLRSGTINEHHASHFVYWKKMACGSIFFRMQNWQKSIALNLG